VPGIIRHYRTVADLANMDEKWKALGLGVGLPSATYAAYRDDAHAVDPGDLAAPPELNGADGLADDFRERDAILNRVANLLTTSSDVYTVYIALVDNNLTFDDPTDDRYLRRVQLTVDRTNCYRSPDARPKVIARQDSSYYDVTR
jgi:hypothetical protein